jgi:hypothetical protein
LRLTPPQFHNVNSSRQQQGMNRLKASAAAPPPLDLNQLRTSDLRMRES